jgi:flagellar hook assembly protein FlgD/outer membrane protein OmpA-like peptidoglycan-associated protein
MKNTGRLMLSVAVLLAAAGTSWSESSFLDFTSPAFLGGGAVSVSPESPPGTGLNPAVSADKQRVTLDLSYIALLDLGSPFNWGGNVVNLGITWPTRVGVVSGMARFANAGFTGQGLDWGYMGEITGSFSKILFPDLYVGAGLGFQFGSDWGLGLDLGFLNIVGNVGFLKDFRWGVALRNLGKAYGSTSTTNALGTPPNFTPAVGASFNLLKTDTLQLSLAPDLSFPSFQDVRFVLGLQFGVADTFSLVTNLTLDLRQALGVEPSRTLPLGFGMSLRLSGLGVKTAGQEVTEIRTALSAAPLQGSIWGFGLGANVPIGVRDTRPPAITIDTDGVKYISPNFDGVKDDLVLAITITDDRYVKGYRFVITDAAGAAVRTIQNKEERPENTDVKNILARLAYVDTGITIPPTLRWDGKNDSGAVVPDGTYAYRLEATDDNGNAGASAPGSVVVDTTPPTVTVAAPYLIFSPDGDGNKDTLPLQQSGSSEDLWTGTVTNIAGETVKTFTWQDAAPPSFSWDGKAQDGILAPDGVYSYRVAATDRAGNGGTAQLDNIIIDTRPTPVQLSIDLSYFSPGTASAKRTVTFTLGVPVATGIEKWSLAVKDDKDATRRTFAGTVTIPATVSWNGTDDSGAVLPEGAYSGTLTVQYVNGKNPVAESPVVTIDTTAPRAGTKAEFDVFSPNGDGNKDTVTIFQDTSEELFWTGVLRGSDNKDLKTLVWRGRADDKWTWDGKGDDGSLLPDGTYVYTLTSTDRAGNVGTSAAVSIRIDTEATPVRLSTDPQYFSPNGDGVKDKVRLIPSVRVTAGVDSWTFRVRDEKGTVVRTWTGRSKAPDEVAWDGIDDAGKHAPDGAYTAALDVNYVNGNKPHADSAPFFIDTHAPQVTVSSDALLFSPAPDSRLAAVTIKQTSSDEDLWEGEMKTAAGQHVRGWFWKGKAADFSWDGKDDNGNLMPDGYYTYTVKSQSKGGTTTAKQLTGIQVDTRPAPVYVTVDSNGFSPNGDGFRDTMTVSMLVSLKDGIKSWKLALVNAAGAEAKTFTGVAPVPATLPWDGKDQTGTRAAPDGLYTAVLQVEYLKGTFSEARSTPFRLAVNPPKIDLGLQGLPFSPDNDGVSDELGITIKVDGPVPVVSWQLDISDPQAHAFTSFAGKGAPSEQIIWNGLSSNGELVQSAEDYPMTFTVRDELGNTASVKKVIPVDILVIRDGDRLKVRIASITFAANTPDYVNVEADAAAKNGVTIQRLAEIFKKYSKYRIEIDGFANIVNFDNPAKAKVEQDTELIPLSKARADAIRAALIAQGIEAGRITTVGKGGADPVVPFSDIDNRWKNRRVEFVLVRQ